MAIAYMKVEQTAKEIRKPQARGETYREIGASHVLTKNQIKELKKHIRRDEMEPVVERTFPQVS